MNSPKPVKVELLHHPRCVFVAISQDILSCSAMNLIKSILCDCRHQLHGTHHQTQPGLRKSGKIVKKDEELLARQVERDQLVRGGDGGGGLRVEEVMVDQ